MTRKTRANWRLPVATLAIAAALAIGGTLAWAATAAPQVFADVQDDNNAAAIQIFNQAKALYQQGKYPEAAALNDKALKLNPDNINAQLLQKILHSKIGDTTTGTTSTSNQTEGPSSKMKELTLEQVSQIRLQELASNETQIRGSIDRAALEDFWNKVIKNQPGVDLSSHDAFVNPNNFAKQVQQFRDSNDPHFLSHVQVSSDPADMIEFRKTVHAFVLKNCATSTCHGGDRGGDFRLLTPLGPSTDQLIYTNFYIMSMYTSKDGGRMINRDDPDMSLFLQYSLPKDAAKYTHPGTTVVHHFASADDPQFKLMSDWVRSLALPRPNYGVVYDLPKSSAPATKPATTTRPAK